MSWSVRNLLIQKRHFGDRSQAESLLRSHPLPNAIEMSMATT